MAKKSKKTMDRKLVSKQKHELNYLKDKTGASGQLVAAAQRAVGPSRVAVQKYIREKLKAR